MATSLLAGKYGTLTLNGNGAYTYAPDSNNPTVQALNVGQALTETFTYTAKDSLSGLTASSTLVITIAGTDDAPVVTVDKTAQTVLSSSTPITGIRVSDMDRAVPGSTERVTVSVTNGRLNIRNLHGATVSGGALNSSAVILSGTLAQLNAALGTLIYSSCGFIGMATLTVIANDGQYDSPVQTIALTVAKNAGRLGNPAMNFRGRLNSHDSHDYYQFTLGSKTSQFHLWLGDLTANANVAIYKLNPITGTWVSYLNSSKPCTQAEVLNHQSLDAGTYLIDVLLADGVVGSTSYSLSFQSGSDRAIARAGCVDKRGDPFEKRLSADRHWRH